MNDRRYYLRVQGRVTGPFTVQQLQSLHQRGQLRAFHELSEDCRAWQSATVLAELFPAPAPAETRVAPTAPPSAGASPSAVAEWYYMDADGTQRGPVLRQELAALLRAGRISDGTGVWKQGMDDWVPLSAVDLSGPPPGGPPGAGAGGSAAGMIAAWEDITGWRRVRTGLLLVIIATLLLFLQIGVGAFVVLVSLLSDKDAAKALIVFGEIVLLIVGLAHQITQAVGFGFCVAAPPRSRGRALAVAALVLAILRFLMDLATPVLVYAAGITSLSYLERATSEVTGGVAVVLATLSYFAAVACWTVFLLFLRTVCIHFKEERHAQAVVFLAILYGVMVILLFGLILCFFVFAARLFFLSSGPLWGLATFGVVVLGLWLAWLVWYLFVLLGIRKFIQARLPAVAEMD